MSSTSTPQRVIGGEPPDRIRRSVEEASNNRRKTLIAFYLLTVAIVTTNFLFCELAARFVVYLGKPASSQNPQYDSKTLVADTVYAGDDNIILCGDSLMKQGLFPELLASKLHKINEHIRVVNLATNAGSQKDATYFLDYILKTGVKPRLVIFDYEVANTGYLTKENNMEWGQAKSYLFNGVLSRPTNIVKSCEIYLKDYSYVARHQGNLKHFLLEFLSILPNPAQFKRKTFFELSDVNDRETSWCGMSPDHKLTSSKDRVEQEWRIHSSLSHSPQGGHFHYNSEAYSIIIDYCQQHQLPLCLVWLPHEKSIYNAHWYKTPYDAAWYREQFDTYASKPFVFPLFLNTLNEDCAYFSDYRHLSTYGCVKTTELLADGLMSKQHFRNILIDNRIATEK